MRQVHSWLLLLLLLACSTLHLTTPTAASPTLLSTKRPGSLRSHWQQYLEEGSKYHAGVKFVPVAHARRALQENSTGSAMSGQKIAIVGAGIAGLSAALQIQDKMPDNDVTIFESADHVGGRLYSYRFPQDPSVYIELGAMRFSERHILLQDLVNLLSSKNQSLPIAQWYLEHPGNRVYLNGVRNNNGTVLTVPQANQAQKSQGAQGLGFQNGTSNAGKTAEELLMEVFQPFFNELQAALTSGGEDAFRSKFLDYVQGRNGSAALDLYSMKDYLLQVANWSDNKVAYVETARSQSSFFDVSFLEVLIDEWEFSADPAGWYTIDGGVQKLAYGAANVLEKQKPGIIQYNTRVVEIQQRADGKVMLIAVQNANNTNTVLGNNRVCPTIASPKRVALGPFDKVLLAVPAPAVRTMKYPNSWSTIKKQGLRSVHYNPLRKTVLLFKTRWWENSNYTNPPIFGGQSITDLASRWIVYPSVDIGSKGKGALMTYAWANDAYIQLTLTREQRIEQALRDLTELHGSVVREQYIPGSAIPFEWSLTYAGGLGNFLPGQWVQFYAGMIKPEGNVYFAGEHLSPHHQWVEGALDSAQVAVRQMFYDHVISNPGSSSVSQENVANVLSDMPFTTGNQGSG